MKTTEKKNKKDTYQAIVSIKISNFLICLCCFDLSCPIILSKCYILYCLVLFF